MKIKDRLNQLAPYQQGKQIQDIKKHYKLDRIVKLSSNENPYGFSPKIKEFLIDYVPAFDIYPDGYTRELRKELAKNLNVHEQNYLWQWIRGNHFK